MPWPALRSAGADGRSIPRVDSTRSLATARPRPTKEPGGPRGARRAEPAVTRRRAGLLARLGSGDEILCGRCGEQLGRIVSSPMEGPRVPLLPLTFGVSVTATGIGTFTEGAWHRLARTDPAERQGRPLSRRPLPGDGGYGRPPDGYIPLKVGARIDCPDCDARQTLDDRVLNLDYRTGSARLGSTPWWDDSTPRALMARMAPPRRRD